MITLRWFLCTHCNRTFVAAFFFLLLFLAIYYNDKSIFEEILVVEGYVRQKYTYQPLLSKDVVERAMFLKEEYRRYNELP